MYHKTLNSTIAAAKNLAKESNGIIFFPLFPGTPFSMGTQKSNSQLSWQDYLKSVAPTQILSERGSNLVVINPGACFFSFEISIRIKGCKALGFMEQLVCVCM